MNFNKLDPIQIVVKDLDRADVYIFEDFAVEHVVDAIIVRRLFEALMCLGVGIVVSSAYSPGNLYACGAAREKFLAFDVFLNKNFENIELNAEVHR